MSASQIMSLFLSVRGLLLLPLNRTEHTWGEIREGS